MASWYDTTRSHWHQTAPVPITETIKHAHILNGVSSQQQPPFLSQHPYSPAIHASLAADFVSSTIQKVVDVLRSLLGELTHISYALPSMYHLPSHVDHLLACVHDFKNRAVRPNPNDHLLIAPRPPRLLALLPPRLHTTPHSSLAHESTLVPTFSRREFKIPPAVARRAAACAGRARAPQPTFCQHSCITVTGRGRPTSFPATASAPASLLGANSHTGPPPQACSPCHAQCTATSTCQTNSTCTSTGGVIAASAGSCRRHERADAPRSTISPGAQCTAKHLPNEQHMSQYWRRHRRLLCQHHQHQHQHQQQRQHQHQHSVWTTLVASCLRSILQRGLPTTA